MLYSELTLLVLLFTKSAPYVKVRLCNLNWYFQSSRLLFACKLQQKEVPVFAVKGASYCVRNVEDQHHAARIGGQTQDSATNPVSSCVNPFSYTNFTVPYTGGFTVTRTASAKHGDSERRPLIESR